MTTILTLFNNYGYVILFFSLTLELIALPLPGELLMTYCGFLIYEEKLNWYIAWIVATLGVIQGITISYFMGKRLTINLLSSSISYLHINSKSIEKTSYWFSTYGNKLLIFSYFIPFVRHISGYFSGMSKMSFKTFASNAYLGASIWTFSFLIIGDLLGPNWTLLESHPLKYFFIICSFILISYTIFLLYNNRKILLSWLKSSLNYFKLYRKYRFVNVILLVIIISVYLNNIIQVYLSSNIHILNNLFIIFNKQNPPIFILDLLHLIMKFASLVTLYMHLQLFLNHF